MTSGAPAERAFDPTFAYMRWAKAQAADPPAFNLAQSGLPPPTPALLPLEGLATDLGQQSPDMPREARRRVAAWWGAEEDEIMLTLGTSQAMFLAAAMTLRPGDRCFVERPAYEQLTGLPAIFGAEAVAFDRDFEGRYALPVDLPARIDAERPRLVLMTNPHNPTGIVLPRAALAPVAEACAAIGALLCVDEVYLPFLDEPGRHSAFGLPATVVASSLTKPFGLGAIRFGWLAGAAPFVDRAIRYNDFCAVLYPNPSAWVAMRAFDHLDVLRARARQAEAGRERLRAFIDGRADIAWQPPDAGIVAFPRLLASDVGAICERLRREHDTLVVPGAFFGAPRHIRVAFGAAPDVVDEGLRRLALALAG
jgi:aspartate/methionine/tyrosine aminotransferase